MAQMSFKAIFSTITVFHNIPANYPVLFEDSTYLILYSLACFFRNFELFFTTFASRINPFCPKSNGSFKSWTKVTV